MPSLREDNLKVFNLQEIPFVILIASAVLVGLYISNILYDLKVPNYISRKIGHSAGGLGFLLCAFLFSTGWWPFILAIAFTAMLWGARFIRPDTFRGVGGTGRATQAMAEVWFPLSAIPVIGVGWIWLDKPFVAISCLLFMAWGDCVTGIVRSQIVGKAQKHWSGSVGCFVTCLIIGWALVQPLFLVPILAATATITEWACGDVGLIKWADDNWAIPVVSATVVFGILALIGGL